MKREEFNNKYTEKKFGWVNCSFDKEYKKTGNKNEWGSDEYDYEEITSAKWCIDLPHSCDEWVIGDIGEAEEFLENLKKAIAYCKENPIVI